MAPDPTPEPTVSVVVVTYRQGTAVRATLEALGRELRDGDELIVVDNDSGDETPDVVAAAAPQATLIRSRWNAGFPAACNVGAADASGSILVFLNPDSVPAPGWRDAIAAPAAAGEWDAWQALVTAEGGTRINTRGGVVHFTGIAWAGGAGEPTGGDEPPGGAEPTANAKPTADAKPTAGDERGALPRPLADATSGVAAARARGEELHGVIEPGFASGACLAIRREVYERVGGFAPAFFLYHEDVDLSLRVRLAGGRIGVAADARVDHDYEFDKGPAKWRYLERNRWATLIRTYPGALLVLLAPALAVTELALLAAAAAGGWLPQKLAAWGDTVRALPALVRERREVQATRAIGAAEFARPLTPELASAYLGAAGRSAVLGALLRGYWALVLRLLGGSPGAGAGAGAGGD